MNKPDVSDDIDNLLAQYLEVVDEYDQFRRRLHSLQISAQQNLARAKFSAVRGTRYGEEFYDSRMQAIRLCRITVNAENRKTTFTVFTKDTSRKELGLSVDDKANEIGTDGSSQEKIISDDIGQTTGDKAMTNKHNPIRMFGILSQTPLRLVQADSIKMVNIIPKLVELAKELAQIEIKIRHLRKMRSKARAIGEEGVNR
ncbi:hypothetical protein HI914_05089 [Erysiphe necator]|nr:hypothetical protein HI914_05089 [Erysiphe necator]